MSEPQIAHRCRSCGVSIRERAFFCPQCGKPVESKPDTTETAQAEHDGASPGEPDPEAGQIPAETVTEFNSAAAAPTVAAFPNSPSEPAPQVASHVGNVPETASKGGVQQVVHGVERLRHLPGVVLDEASYDPSLRFVLVAAFLFGMFLLLLLLSELIT